MSSRKVIFNNRLSGGLGLEDSHAEADYFATAIFGVESTNSKSLNQSGHGKDVLDMSPPSGSALGSGRTLIPSSSLSHDNLLSPISDGGKENAPPSTCAALRCAAKATVNPSVRAGEGDGGKGKEHVDRGGFALPDLPATFLGAKNSGRLTSLRDSTSDLEAASTTNAPVQSVGFSGRSQGKHGVLVATEDNTTHAPSSSTAASFARPPPLPSTNSRSSFLELAVGNLAATPKPAQSRHTYNKHSNMAPCEVSPASSDGQSPSKDFEASLCFDLMDYDDDDDDGDDNICDGGDAAASAAAAAASVSTVVDVAPSADDAPEKDASIGRCSGVAGEDTLPPRTEEDDSIAEPPFESKGTAAEAVGTHLEAQSEMAVTEKKDAFNGDAAAGSAVSAESGTVDSAAAKGDAIIALGCAETGLDCTEDADTHVTPPPSLSPAPLPLPRLVRAVTQSRVCERIRSGIANRTYIQPDTRRVVTSFKHGMGSIGDTTLLGRIPTVEALNGRGAAAEDNIEGRSEAANPSTNDHCAAVSAPPLRILLADGTDLLHFTMRHGRKKHSHAVGRPSLEGSAGGPSPTDYDVQVKTGLLHGWEQLEATATLLQMVTAMLWEEVKEEKYPSAAASHSGALPWCEYQQPTSDADDSSLDSSSESEPDFNGEKKPISSRRSSMNRGGSGAVNASQVISAAEEERVSSQMTTSKGLRKRRARCRASDSEVEVVSSTDSDSSGDNSSSDSGDSSSEDSDDADDSDGSDDSTARGRKRKADAKRKAAAAAAAKKMAESDVDVPAGKGRSKRLRTEEGSIGDAIDRGDVTPRPDAKRAAAGRGGGGGGMSTVRRNARPPKLKPLPPLPTCIPIVVMRLLTEVLGDEMKAVHHAREDSRRDAEGEEPTSDAVESGPLLLSIEAIREKLLPKLHGQTVHALRQHIKKATEDDTTPTASSASAPTASASLKMRKYATDGSAAKVMSARDGYQVATATSTPLSTSTASSLPFSVKDQLMDTLCEVVYAYVNKAWEPRYACFLQQPWSRCGGGGTGQRGLSRTPTPPPTPCAEPSRSVQCPNTYSSVPSLDAPIQPEADATTAALFSDSMLIDLSFDVALTPTLIDANLTHNDGGHTDAGSGASGGDVFKRECGDVFKRECDAVVDVDRDASRFVKEERECEEDSGMAENGNITPADHVGREEEEEQKAAHCVPFNDAASAGDDDADVRIPLVDVEGGNGNGESECVVPALTEALLQAHCHTIDGLASTDSREEEEDDDAESSDSDETI